jgi:hypothetical protein
MLIFRRNSSDHESFSNTFRSIFSKHRGTTNGSGSMITGELFGSLSTKLNVDICSGKVFLSYQVF